MDDLPDSESQQAMGLRLRAVREALGLSQEEMADRLGIGHTGLSSWENGRTRIDFIKLARVAKRYRFTLDWIGLGDLSALPHELAMKLEAMMRDGGPPRRGRPQKRQYGRKA